MKYRAVLFDFDYTLGDSTKGIVLSANAALQRMGLEAQSEEAIRRTVGLSLRDTYRALTGDENPQAADSFAAFFREKADQVMAESAVLYPSVPPLLKALRSQGLRTGVVTTKFRYRILQILGEIDYPAYRICINSLLCCRSGLGHCAHSRERLGSNHKKLTHFFLKSHISQHLLNITVCCSTIYIFCL